MAVAAARWPPYPGGVNVTSDAQVCANQPPSGCGSRSSASAVAGRTSKPV
jgi:hypothetical protein